MSIAAISVISSALLGGAAILFSYLNAKGQREHEKELAQETRIQARREEAYPELLEAVRRIGLGVGRNASLMRSPGDPEAPSPLEDAAIVRLDALLAVFGSGQVRALLKNWFDTTAAFYEAMRDGPEGERGTPTKAMRDAAAEVFEAEDALAAAMRKDLGQSESDEGTTG